MNRRLGSRKVALACATGLLFSAMIAAPVAAAPSNDNFANAVNTAPLPFSDTRAFTGATPQTGEPMADCYDHSVGASVWYRFQPGQTMTVLADTFGSGLDTSIAVYTGSALGSLTQVSCNSHTYQDMDQLSSVAWTATQNVSYSIQVILSFRGHLTDSILHFHLKSTTPPSNDKVSTAKVITSLPFKASFSNRSATSQGEPAPVAGCARTGAQVWYRFKPSSTMYVQVDTLQSDYASTLAVYKGTTLGSLTPVICDSETWGGYSGMQSLATFRAVAGTTYTIQIGGDSGSSGNTELVIRKVTPPANDAFASAKLITVPAGINGYAFTNRKATLQAGEPHGSCASAGPVATLWFKFTVTIDPNNPDNQPNYNFYVSGGPSFFTTVYHGTSLGNLTELNCTNYTNFAPTGPLPAGTYYVQVGGLIGQTGYGSLNFDLVP